MRLHPKWKYLDLDSSWTHDDDDDDDEETNPNAHTHEHTHRKSALGVVSFSLSVFLAHGLWYVNDSKYVVFFFRRFDAHCKQTTEHNMSMCVRSVCVKIDCAVTELLIICICHDEYVMRSIPICTWHAMCVSFFQTWTEITKQQQTCNESCKAFTIRFIIWTIARL